jgi:hypothetical protein
MDSCEIKSLFWFVLAQIQARGLPQYHNRHSSISSRPRVQLILMNLKQRGQAMPAFME